MPPVLDLADLQERLRRHVATLAGEPRPPDSDAHRAARDYIRTSLEASGFVVQEETAVEEGVPCINLLTQPLPARPDLPLFVIGAHYDSVRTSPGADDNASAVAALLELARWLRPRLEKPGPFACRVQLVAYDLEEYGLVGSFLHSRQLQEARVRVAGMISLEMLGYVDDKPGSQRLPPDLVGLYPDVANFIGVCGNVDSAGLVQTVTQALKDVAGLPVEFITVPGRGEIVYQVRLSDHASFWDRGYQALMITDTSFFRNPHYHQATDTPQTLDYAFLAKVTAGVCGAVERLLTATS